MASRKLNRAAFSLFSTESRPRTALAQADGQTKAVSLTARIAANPDELPLAAAELLSAQVIHPTTTIARDNRNTLKIPSSRGPVLLSRPTEPFTPAESARAHRLAELAETLELNPRTAVPSALPRSRPGRVAHTPHPPHTRTTSCHRAGRRNVDAPHARDHSGSGR